MNAVATPVRRRLPRPTEPQTRARKLLTAIVANRLIASIGRARLRNGPIRESHDGHDNFDRRLDMLKVFKICHGHELSHAVEFLYEVTSSVWFTCGRPFGRRLPCSWYSSNQNNDLRVLDASVRDPQLMDPGLPSGSPRRSRHRRRVSAQRIVVAWGCARRKGAGNRSRRRLTLTTGLEALYRHVARISVAELDDFTRGRQNSLPFPGRLSISSRCTVIARRAATLDRAAARALVHTERCCGCGQWLVERTMACR